MGHPLVLELKDSMSEKKEEFNNLNNKPPFKLLNSIYLYFSRRKILGIPFVYWVK